MWGVEKWGSAKWGVNGTVVTAAGTSWNPNWANDYGPDADNAKKAKKKAKKATEFEVQAAISTLTGEAVGKYFEEAVEIAHTRSLASELMSDEEDLIIVMNAYYAWQRRMQDEEDIAAILLLI
jgi:hypothetical protein|tara:strand:- start:99 stop:467 length:369 start_codon:yes stop_codon:yes gene_type:complete